MSSARAPARCTTVIVMSWPAPDADERTTLVGALDGLRAVLASKADGLDGAALARRLQPSEVTIGGLLKHLAVVEDDWFTRCLAGHPLPEPWASVDWDADIDWDWHSAADDSPAQLRAQFEASLARSRAVIDATDSLDTRSADAMVPGGDTHCTLRWLLVHMIEEYARHAGHADLIRESIDGSTGD